jgi:hypothetical protein
MGKLAAGGAGLALLNLAGAETAGAAEHGTTAAQGQSPAGAQVQAIPAFRGQHQPKPLPFDPAKLKGLSEKLIRSHWENNYGGSVGALNAPTGRPLLVLDMYEHSYHMDYGSAAAKYVEAFMQNVNWEEVNRRFVGARKMAALV